MIDQDRVTERVNVATLRLELKRAAQPLIVLAIGLAVAAASGYYILRNINGGIGGTHTMQFEVANATGVVPGRAETRFLGVQAGIVTNARLVNGHSVLTATIASKFGPVYRNATAELRPNTALQDMYLDVVSRGTPSAGVAPPGYVIPLDQTQSPTNLADVLNLFQPDIRAQLNNILNQGGNGLRSRGVDLRQALIDLAPFLSIAGNVSRQLAVRATLTKELVHNAATLSGVLAERSTQLHGLITNGTTTLEALSTQNAVPLHQMVNMLPGALAHIDRFWSNVDGILPQPIDTTIAALTPAVNDLGSGLRNLKAFAAAATPAVRRLETPVVKLVPLAEQLDPFASQLSASLNQISPQVPDVNIATLATSKCTLEIQKFMSWDTSMLKFRDVQGNDVRGNFNFGFYSLPGGQSTTYTYRKPQCAGGVPIGGIPTPKYPGPPPAP
jgi:ABC-type transporter Mla subunit MlaD